MTADMNETRVSRTMEPVLAEFTLQHEARGALAANTEPGVHALVTDLLHVTDPKIHHRLRFLLLRQLERCHLQGKFNISGE